MAKAKNGEPVEGEAPVKKAPASLEDRHRKLQSDRRDLEAELSGIDGQIRAAIDNGDLKAIDKLTARKAELPRLFITASTSERQARQEIFNAEDAENLKRLRAAEDLRDGLRQAMTDLVQRHTEELAALKAELGAAEAEVGGAYVAIQASRDLGASGEAGFRRSLAALAGV